jgi:hypothetical protein
MHRFLWLAGAAAVLIAAGVSATSHAQPPKPVAVFTADGKLEFPKDYRTWVYLSSGMDMAYVDAPGMADHHMFDNVFVDRASYDAFRQTGHWPEGTMFVLEVRGGETKGSINRKGLFQTGRMAVEVHLKDPRFQSGWAFFPFNGERPAQALPQTSQCNSCHEAHGAVDTTFVQFYPTLLPLAKDKKTLSAAYVAEENSR